ncbi:hypothetical protein VK792_06285 [Mesobacterium sp. TK19101]|uniref:Uncharacterized protein n=1 Tax=Mesobacterium hydrothermale TaxID=3111907 RepID=A0ABU6HIB9_9RHOB|nr:hypothetical protein [Mesobacterium sp. TK19101]MEC3860885.1 hypothetical protein [Mesobacterium sp. TK19101]
MPLGSLVVLVVGGIAGIALLTHVLGWSQPRQLLTEEDASRGWLREFPDTTVTSVTLCANGAAALIASDAGPGLVWPMGADTSARFLTGAQVTVRKDRLIVRLQDYTAPRITLRLGPDDCAAWRDRIRGTT